ncbi:MAG: Hsp20/alpha crystallin family protein [Bacteroidetes bacterium]|nr:Hsp20/alpha crystallin family protein [Bacteroidota bacterium]
MNTLMKRPGFFDTDLWDFPTRFWNTDGLELREGRHPVNIRDTGKTYEVELAAPGYAKDDLKVSLDEGLLTIRCEKQDEREDRDHGFTRREFRMSSFRRSFQLPDAANEDDLKARYENGVLRITIGKRKDADVKKARNVTIE